MLMHDISNAHHMAKDTDMEQNLVAGKIAHV